MEGVSHNRHLSFYSSLAVVTFRHWLFSYVRRPEVMRMDYVLQSFFSSMYLCNDESFLSCSDWILCKSVMITTATGEFLRTEQQRLSYPEVVRFSLMNSGEQTSV